MVYSDEKFEFKIDKENGMIVGPDNCHYENKKSAMYYGQLGFCGCGDPQGTHLFTCEALSVFDREGHREVHGKDAWIDAMKSLTKLVSERPEDAAYFIAYALDKANLTEHGGSVGGSWLTERGEQFLEIGPMGEEDDV